MSNIEKTKNGLAITIHNNTEDKIYTVDATSELLVSVGNEIRRGEKLMKGSIHPKELLRIKEPALIFLWFPGRSMQTRKIDKQVQPS